jgi:hypothetical protein
VKTIDELLPKMGPADTAWLKIWRQKYGLTAENISKKLQDKMGDAVDPVSIESYLLRKGVLPLPSDGTEEGIPAATTDSVAFSSAMERDIESALLSQLNSLGLQLFTDDSGRNGQQYPAGEFGRIDILTTDSNENFVVIELKREDVPRATIGQIAGYIAFVRKTIAKPKGRSVTGWILARPSSPNADSMLEESANAVGVLVKWYEVKLNFLDSQSLDGSESRE